jgi:hypothetical protein
LYLSLLNHDPRKNRSSLHYAPTELRTWISYFALLATTTCAALLKESRMQIFKATDLDRKSG